MLRQSPQKLLHSQISHYKLKTNQLFNLNLYHKTPKIWVYRFGGCWGSNIFKKKNNEENCYTSYPIWSDAFQNSFQRSKLKLVGLFLLKRGKRDLCALTLSLWKERELRKMSLQMGWAVTQNWHSATHCNTLQHTATHDLSEVRLWGAYN